MPQTPDSQDPRPERELEPTPSAVPAQPAPVPGKPAVAPKNARAADDEEDQGMLRMSFLEHLEELRTRIIRALMGVGVAFALCIFWSDQLWNAVRRPAVDALAQLHLPTDLAQITPTEAFTIVWVRLPILAAIFVASPWVLYQAWAFIAPGLYKKERRLAAPFILTCAGLFIIGGLFAYLVAFRFGLVFLLGIGPSQGIKPMISVSEYFDLFVNVILGVALVFELPVLIFFLTLLRVASPRFLLAHSRYAVLLIVIAAAIITPTPDVYNLTIFAAPMILLYFVGVFASYLLVLSREGKKFPWGVILSVAGGVLVLVAGVLYLLVARYGFHWVKQWPFLVR
jgi:sec-independent protein translocase protein TatC